jgi:hypothetical protein
MTGAGAGSARGCSSRGTPPRGPAPPTIIPTTAGPSAASPRKTDCPLDERQKTSFQPTSIWIAPIWHDIRNHRITC